MLERYEPSVAELAESGEIEFSASALAASRYRRCVTRSLFVSRIR